MKGLKTGGRKPGSVNRVTGSMRKLLDELIRGQWYTVQNDLKSLKPKDRLFIISKLLKFTTPEFSSVNMNLNAMSDDELQRIVEHIRETESTDEQAQRID